MNGSAGMNLGQWWVKPPIPALLPHSLMGTPDDYRGCLLGGAIGDALGRPMEGKSLERIRSIFPGEVRDFIPHRRWIGGPEGTFTDDTEMTLCIAESYLENGRLIPRTSRRGSRLGSSWAAAAAIHVLPRARTSDAVFRGTNPVFRRLATAPP